MSPAAASKNAGPFTAANVAGLMATAALGAAMAFYARVRVTITRTPTAVSG
jgi:hypothetical protein